MFAIFSFFYTTFISHILMMVECCLAFINQKVRERRNGLSEQRKNIHGLVKQDAPVIWFHAASMGEFEQLKPVIEYIAHHSPNVQRVVTFSSPSGYRNSRNYAYADAVLYREDDTMERMQLMIEAIHPNVVVIDRYDVWRTMVSLCSKAGAMVVIVNATYPSNTMFRNRLGRRLVQWLYSGVTTIIPITQSDFILFKAALPHSEVHTPLPDTRYDRVLSIVQEQQMKRAYHWIRERTQKPILVCGSTWAADEKCIMSLHSHLLDKWQIILVPHEPSDESIQRIRSLCSGSVVFSELTPSLPFDGATIIVDSIGKLLALYSIADAAYIGGGFGAGVHSVAEPAAYGLPLACGPAIERNYDANILAQKNLLSVCTHSDELEAWLSGIDLVVDSDSNKPTAMYIQQQAGSSRQISEMIRQVLQNSNSASFSADIYRR